MYISCKTNIYIHTHRLIFNIGRLSSCQDLFFFKKKTPALNCTDSLLLRKNISILYIYIYIEDRLTRFKKWNYIQQRTM